MQKLKEGIHYSFIKDDLRILIDNFTEGARRINTIVTDLRTFSRMDTDTISEVICMLLWKCLSTCCEINIKTVSKSTRNMGISPKFKATRAS